MVASYNKKNVKADYPGFAIITIQCPVCGRTHQKPVSFHMNHHAGGEISIGSNRASVFCGTDCKYPTLRGDTKVRK